MASDYNYKLQMSRVFSVVYRTSERKSGAISERERKGSSDSAPAAAIFVVRSTPLHPGAGAGSEERSLDSWGCPSLMSNNSGVL